jgi:hypothetical protein
MLTEAGVSTRLVRIGVAILVGVITGYIAARINVAVHGPCAGTPSGSAVCIPPDPNWLLAIGVGVVVAAVAWFALSRFRGSRHE